MRKNKTLVTIAAVVLCAVMIISGTFAWITARDTVVNKLSTSDLGAGNVVIVETFTPPGPGEWVPDAEITKDVKAMNTGEYPVLVRISFEEYLKKLITQTTPSTDANKAQTVTADIPDPTGVGDMIRVNTTTTDYTSGWIPATSTMIQTATGVTIPTVSTDTELYIMYNVVTAAGGSQTYSAVAYYKYGVDADGNPLYQKVDMDCEFIKDSAGTLETIQVNSLTYWFYAGYQNEGSSIALREKDWAEPYSGSKNDIVGDADAPYGTAAGYSGTHIARTAGGGIVSSTVGANTYDALVSQMDANLKINLCSDSSVYGGTFASPSATQNWYYNQADGYFYYLKPLAAGATTESVMKSINLDKVAGNAYGLMDWHLGIVMEAVQATEGVIGTAGAADGTWGIADTNLSSYLKTLCF